LVPLKHKEEIKSKSQTERQRETGEKAKAEKETFVLQDNNRVE
jgi:hypothetical protein